MKYIKVFEQVINESEESYSDYPKAASANAKKALEWRDKYGRDEVDAGTPVGWQRANQLAKGEALSKDVVSRMAQFNRHRKNSKIAPEFKDTPWKDRGYVAWLIWGGDEGVDWAMKKMEQIKKEEVSEMKHVKLFEEFINESLKFKDLVDKKFDIELGSGTTGKIWNKEDLIEAVKDVIKHNLFDGDFKLNWTDNDDEYTKVFDKDTLQPLLKNIDKTLNDLFTFTNNKLTFNIQGRKKQEWIDNWFQTNKSISKSLKQDYYDYRDEYAGVKLK